MKRDGSVSDFLTWSHTWYQGPVRSCNIVNHDCYSERPGRRGYNQRHVYVSGITEQGKVKWLGAGGGGGRHPSPFWGTQKHVMCANAPYFST